MRRSGPLSRMTQLRTPAESRRLRTLGHASRAFAAALLMMMSGIMRGVNGKQRMMERGKGEKSDSFTSCVAWTSICPPDYLLDLLLSEL